jgi:hypothetical protein
MEKKLELNFIDGDFKTKEAKELLMDLFTKKIKFHEMKNFSTLVRFGDEDKTSQARTNSLRESIEALNSFFDEIENEKVRLSVHSKIVIEVKND